MKGLGYYVVGGLALVLGALRIAVGDWYGAILGLLTFGLIAALPTVILGYIFWNVRQWFRNRNPSLDQQSVVAPVSYSVNEEELEKIGLSDTRMGATSFWVAFVTLLLVSLFLTLGMVQGFLNSGPMTWLTAALPWIAVVALAWSHWTSRSTWMLGRIAGAVGLAMLSMTLFEWFQSMDVFLECRPGCPPRTGTFWKVVTVWLGGLGLLSYVLWPCFRYTNRSIQATPSSFVWAPLVLAWTGACGYLFARDVTWAVTVNSFLTAGKIVLVIAAIIAALGLFVLIVSFPAMRRDKRARGDFAKLDSKAKHEILRRIDDRCRREEYQLWYRIAKHPPSETELARIGGSPLGLDSEQWPTERDGKHGRFLLQLPLRAPRLSAVWQRRFLVIFLIDYQLLVRSYNLDSQQLVPLARQGAVDHEPLALEEIAIPYVPTNDVLTEDEESSGGFDPESIFGRVAGLKEDLARLSEQPERLLALILTESKSTVLCTETEILVGGDPQLIQNEHEATCGICGKPMRFLMQSCDVTDDEAFGDVGVAYVYGCDDHPEYCQGFVDCH